MHRKLNLRNICSFLFGGAYVFLFFYGIISSSLADEKLSLTKFGHGEVEITTAAQKTYRFNVEVATDDKQRARGLMFRRQMKDMSGMFFIYDQPRLIRMWMKNTILSLDIIFIDEKGTILNIAKNTTPQSLKVIPSLGNTKYVLELNAGLTGYFNIKAGDNLKYQKLD